MLRCVFHHLCGQMNEEILSLFFEQIRLQTPLEWAMTITSLIYVWLAAKENAWCWVWGIISCSIWAYLDFTKYNLWVDGVLQLFYVGMGFWGIYAWRFGKAGDNSLKISTLPSAAHLKILLSGAALTLLLGYVFDRWTPTDLPYPDSFVTAFSILATLLTVKKILENWLYWIVVDALAVVLFFVKQAPLAALVMVVYTVVAVYGYRQWRFQLDTK